MRRKKAKDKVQKSMPVAHVGACYRLHTTEHGDQSIVFKQRQAENKPHGVRGQLDLALSQKKEEFYFSRY